MRNRHLVPAALLLLGWTSAASAQSPPPAPLSRADISATIGWFSAETSDVTRDGEQDWYQRSVHGNIGAGWYWTDTLRTELDFSATSTAKMRTYPRVTIDGQFTNTPIEYAFSTRKLGLAQYYQGYRNAWVTPYAGVGIETTWLRVSETHGPTYIYDSAARTSRQVLPPRAVGPHTDVVVRPFGAVGLKAYMTPRAFFRSDVRVAFRGGVEEVTFRFGFGTDF